MLIFWAADLFLKKKNKVWLIYKLNFGGLFKQMDLKDDD